MRIKRNGVLLLLVLALLLTACSGGKDKGADGKEKLVVGMEAGYAPFNWTQGNDNNDAIKMSGLNEYAGGYDVEMAKKIADGLGMELVIKKLEWDGLLPALTSGTIDVIMAGMSPTEERREVIDFSDHYYLSDLVMIVKKGSQYEDVKSIQDFKGAKLTGQLNTVHYSVLDQIEGASVQTAMMDFPTMRAALEAGIIDGYVSEKPEGMSVLDAGMDFAVVEFEDGFVTNEDERGISAGVKKGSDLVEKINGVLKGISEDERQNTMQNAVETQPVNQ